MKILFAVFLSAIWLASPSMADHEVVEGRQPTIHLGPEELSTKEAGIGKRIPDFSLGLVGGRESNLYAGAGSRGTVIVVRDPGCPVSRRYGPTIAHLAERFGANGFGFIFIYPNEDLGPAHLRRDAKALGVSGSFVVKGNFALANALGVRSTGDVFVLDAGHRMRYRGAVDDQFGLGYTRELATRHYLLHALEALVEGEPVETPATSAPGCVIDPDPERERLFQPDADGRMIS